MNAIDYVRHAKQLGITVENDSGELVLSYPGEKTVRISHPSRNKDATFALRKIVQRVRSKASRIQHPEEPEPTPQEVLGQGPIVAQQAHRIAMLEGEVRWLTDQAARLEQDNAALKQQLVLMVKAAGVALDLVQRMVPPSGFEPEPTE